MIDKALIGAALGLGVWIIKLITNANDPDRQVKKDLLRLMNRKTKLIKQKNKYENQLQNTKNQDKRVPIGARISAINIELAGLRKQIEKLACWK